jgi:ribosomal protein S18 acetylase RimI-like enzyme
MTHGAACRLLEWDSDFFGCRIARVQTKELDAKKLAEVRTFARREKVDCLYYLVNAEDSESILTAEVAGFRCTDIRVTREISVERLTSRIEGGVEAFREDDLSDLKAIARSSHGATRFYNDPHFARERSDSLYERWIVNACAGEADRVLVVRRAGRAVGYSTCEIDSSTTGTIGLLAVAEGERGQGLGECLVRGSLSWFAERERKSVRVVGQARNLASARLYERMGFRTTAVELWYHLWPNIEQST